MSQIELPNKDVAFHLDLPPQQRMPGNSPCAAQARHKFHLLTGVPMPASVTDPVLCLKLYEEGRLTLGREFRMAQEKNKPTMMNPNENEYDWHANQSTASVIDNGADTPNVRNAKFLKEVKQGKMGMIDRNVRIIKENGHIIVPYKGSSWEKLHEFRNKLTNKTITMQEAKSLAYMESYLAGSNRNKL